MKFLRLNLIKDSKEHRAPDLLGNEELHGVGPVPCAPDYGKMSILRRYGRLGDVYFITIVTYKRIRILDEGAHLLKKSIIDTNRKLNIDTIAYVILPEHCHLIIDPNGMDISNIVQRIKMSFAAKYRKVHNLKSGRVWLHRFWDHIIRNQEDLNRHIDYIHYNPIKHGYTGDPKKWEFSSFSEYCGRGYYTKDWGTKDHINIEGEFGE